MQIFDTTQVHAWDDYTIRHEPIPSIALMERAAQACYDWLMKNGYEDKRFSVYCGKGNNGGDGLALARMLANSGHVVSVFILEFGHKGTDDFQENLARLHETDASIHFIPSEETIRPIQADHIIIDALLGSGLNRGLEGLTASVVHHLNNSGHTIISIDMPTGLFADKEQENKVVVKAHYTLSFQSHKLAFLLSENQPYIGELHILDIGLHPGFPEQEESRFHMCDEKFVKALIKPRSKFSHKGDFGTGGLICGSTGMMGAAVLCAKAFMRSGAGKLTCHIPQSGYPIMQTAVPEAMCKLEQGDHYLQTVENLSRYDAVGIGPGIGLHESHQHLFNQIFNSYSRPMVIDADALNVLSQHPDLLQKIPAFSILTPHGGEFERLFGRQKNDFQRIQAALTNAKKFNIIILLKGAYSFIAMPGGKGYFNGSGNPGMATAGAGDALTGIITGLLCQGYPPEHAAIIGAYVHGLAGDLAVSANSQEALIASDIISYLGQAFKKLR